jgi:acetyltransferase-like isoleucine patch superfamily enzyme
MHSTASLVGAIAAVLCFLPAPAHASHSCPTAQPAFAYVDVDNDGCHTEGIDSTSVDAALQAPTTMVNVPSFTAPANTGLVIPVALDIPEEADPYWSVPNDVWIDGGIGGDSSLRIEAGGTTFVNANIRMRSKGFSDASDLELGCSSGCGPTVVAEDMRIDNNGGFVVYDAVIGNRVRINVRCEPGGVPSCGGQAFFYRATSIGDEVRLNSPGGIYFSEGTSLLTVGNYVSMTTKAVSTDGGTLGFPLLIELGAGVSFGVGARLRAGGSMFIDGGEAPVITGPVSIGSDARLSASTLVVRGSSVGVGAHGDLRGKKDISFPGQISTVFLGTSGGPLTIESGTRIAGGRIGVDAGAGVAHLAGDVTLSTAGADQSIELTGGVIEVGPGASIAKATNDLTPISIAAVSDIQIATSALRGAGVNVSVSDPGGTIAFLGSEAKGASGTTATFSAPGGNCDLTGSGFIGMTLDTAGCGLVVGP